MLKLGKDDTFFDLLESQANVAVRAAQAFAALVNDMNNVQARTEELMTMETEGDELTHKLQNKLSATFITPLDQEDLSGLSHLLDDVTDCIESAGARIGMYKLTECRSDFAPFAQNLLEATTVTAAATAELHHQFARSDTLPGILLRIHELENESDRLYRAALTKLFEEETDAILIIKWKDAYDRVEYATDKCATIANLIENMIVKYA